MSSSAFLKSVDSTVGSLLCRIMGCFAASSGGEALPGDLTPGKVAKILLIRPGGMGDMIVLLPVINLLRERYPEASIDIACQKRNVEVLKLAESRVTPLVFDSHPLSFLSRIRRSNYDVVVDTEQFHHFSAVFGSLTRAAVRIGFKINPRRNPLYTHLINYDPDGREGDQFMRLLEPLGIHGAAFDLVGALSDATVDMPESVERHDDPFVVIQPGCSTVYKKWPIENYVELARCLNKDRGLAIALAGDSGDRATCAAILDGIRKTTGKAISYAGDLNLASTAAAIKGSELFIGTDSGLSHLATALGSRTVTLFGPSDHRKWGVENSRHAVVRTSLPCSPCFIFGYHKPCRTIACMKGIRVEDVLAAVDKVMGQ